MTAVLKKLKSSVPIALLFNFLQSVEYILLSHKAFNGAALLVLPIPRTVSMVPMSLLSHVLLSPPFQDVCIVKQINLFLMLLHATSMNKIHSQISEKPGVLRIYICKM